MSFAFPTFNSAKLLDVEFIFLNFCLLFAGWLDNFVLLQGDILFLHMSKDPIRAGEIVVFNVDVCSF